MIGTAVFIEFGCLDVCVTICAGYTHQPQGEYRHGHSYGQIHVDRVRCTLSA